MANINISIPEDLHRNLKIRAATEGKSLKTVVLEGLKRKPQRRKA
ncbi:MAG: hypothetical protein ACLFO2_03750 [Candidatus Woesearchaeota archaeon]